MRGFLKNAIAARRRVAFRVWVSKLRLRLWLKGAKLILDAPDGASFDSPPFLKIEPGGNGDATTTLRLGRNVRLGRNLTLEIHAGGTNSFEAGDNALFLNNIRVLLRSGSVSFGPDTQVRDSAWIKSDGLFRTGTEVTIGPCSAIHCTELIELHDLVGIGERVSITDSDHTFDGTDEHYMKKPLTVGPVRLGRQTMIAFGAIVLRGVEVERNSVVAANSVVRAGTYPEASLLAGNPAKLIRDLRKPRSPG